MSVNWNNIIKDQSRGIDPMTAWNREQERLRKQREEEHQKRLQERKEREERQDDDR